MKPYNLDQDYTLHRTISVTDGKWYMPISDVRLAVDRAFAAGRDVGIHNAQQALDSLLKDERSRP